MSERDPVITALRELDRPAAPRQDFADELLARLLEELAEANGHSARAPAMRRRVSAPWWRRRSVLAAAAAVAVVAALASTVVLSRPAPASALDVIHQAEASFAGAPPFEATYSVQLNPDGSSDFAPRGATATVRASYGGPSQLRMEILRVGAGIPGANAAGSYQVYDGSKVGIYDARTNRFVSSQASAEFEPLEFLSWRGSFPDWERICGDPDSEVLPDGTVSGREARHIRCVDFKGGDWELWIDRETGLLLKVVGQVGGDDFFLGGLGAATSAKGGFEAEQIQYDPMFPPDTFEVAGPPGAIEDQAPAEPSPPDTNADETEIDPFAKTRLERGQPAPSWEATYLDGGAFRLSDLRGKPALLLLFPDWCPPTDPVCEVFGPLEQAYEQSNGNVAVVWVDIQGSAGEAKKVVSHNALTFPVVVDSGDGNSVKAWGVQAWPFWVLLDPQGGVVDARLTPQTEPQLEQILAEVD